MKILYPAAYFYPENTSFTHLEHDLLHTLVSAGHEVEVLCPVPTRGIQQDVQEKFRQVREEILWQGKVRVHRFWAPKEGRNPLIRAFRYFWCAFQTWRIGRKYQDVDLIFGVSTPPIQGLTMARIKRKLNCPCVYIVQDLFPESLVSTGLAKSRGLIWKLGNWVVANTYPAMDGLIVISQSFREALLSRGIPAEKIHVVYNWIDTQRVVPVAREENPLYEELGIPRDKFLVLYAGNLGESQNGKCIVDAAALLQQEPNVIFVIFGGGSEYEVLRRYAEQKELKNIIFHTLLPQERVSQVYSLGDVALITCKPGTGKAGMPSKLWTIMATGTPVLASFDLDSELAKIICQVECGEVIDPDTPVDLAKAIQKAQENLQQLNEIGLRGRKYAVEHVGRNAATAAYLKIFENSVCRRRY